jgi:hypothetical protein
MTLKMLACAAAHAGTVADTSRAQPASATISITKAMETSKTLSPHQMHLNYKAMKELPVHEVKEPF